MADHAGISANPAADALVVVAIFISHPGREAALERTLLALVEPTHAEDGCLRYELNRSLDEAGVYYFTEIWASQAHHRAHLETPHIRHLLEVVPELIAAPIREYKGSLLAGG
jgi:quinol monooxygenase YgiN